MCIVFVDTDMAIKDRSGGSVAIFLALCYRPRFKAVDAHALFMLSSILEVAIAIFTMIGHNSLIKYGKI